MKDNYTYPAIIDYNIPDLIHIEFPDFDFLSTDSDSAEDYIKEAQECLALQLIDLEETGKPIPDPSSVSNICLEDHQKLIYINVWMPFHRTTQKVKYTKKTLTIPVWLDLLAKQNSINFSEVLVEGLKRKLGING